MTSAPAYHAIQDLIEAPAEGPHTAFVEGPAGSGLQDLFVQRLRYLAQAGVDGRQILVLVPSRALIPRLRAALGEATEDLQTKGSASQDVQFFTYYSVAKRSVELFWPVIGSSAGAGGAQEEPAFLTYETAQHVMTRVAELLLEQGFFGDLTLPRPRLYGQLLSSLNAAAASGFPPSEIAGRLAAAWTGDPARERTYEQVQTCLDAYRARCAEQGLVDVARTMELFTQELLDNDAFWSFLTKQYRHLLVFRLEENVPVACDFVRQLLPRCDTALLLYEQNGGVRPFLHVDPESGYALKTLCQHTAVLKPEAPPALEAFASAVSAQLEPSDSDPPAAAPLPSEAAPRRAVRGVIEAPFRTEMLQEVAARVQALCDEGAAPGDIALIAPAVDGVLQFTLSEALRGAGVPLHTLRPRASLRDEPLVRTCLTLAQLAHPHWGQPSTPYDVTEMLPQFIDGLDPVRAALLTRSGYDAGGGRLLPLRKHLDDTAAERIGADALESAERLRTWIEAYAAEAVETPLDGFVRRAVREVCPGSEEPPLEAFSTLVRSIRHFRRYAAASEHSGGEAGAAYVGMVRRGTLTAQYLPRRANGQPEAVTLAPAYTYLLSGRPAAHQFWLDLGAPAWNRSLQQALTNPYVLSRRWTSSDQWSEPQDFAARTDLLRRVVRGLCRRCTGGLYLCTSDRQASGEQQDGPLLRAVQAVLRA